MFSVKPVSIFIEPISIAFELAVFDCDVACEHQDSARAVVVEIAVFHHNVARVECFVEEYVFAEFGVGQWLVEEDFALAGFRFFVPRDFRLEVEGGVVAVSEFDSVADSPVALAGDERIFRLFDAERGVVVEVYASSALARIRSRAP